MSAPCSCGRSMAVACPTAVGQLCLGCAATRIAENWYAGVQRYMPVPKLKQITKARRVVR